jgi:hypothetical protein
MVEKRKKQKNLLPSDPKQHRLPPFLHPTFPYPVEVFFPIDKISPFTKMAGDSSYHMNLRGIEVKYVVDIMIFQPSGFTHRRRAGRHFV